MEPVKFRTASFYKKQIKPLCLCTLLTVVYAQDAEATWYVYRMPATAYVTVPSATCTLNVYADSSGFVTAKRVGDADVDLGSTNVDFGTLSLSEIQNGSVADKRIGINISNCTQQPYGYVRVTTGSSNPVTPEGNAAMYIQANSGGKPVDAGYKVSVESPYIMASGSIQDFKITSSPKMNEGTGYYIGLRVKPVLLKPGASVSGDLSATLRMTVYYD